MMLEFRRSVVTSDAGLLAYRELDDALGLSDLAGETFAGARTGKNGRHALVGLVRQSVFERLAGHEDVNDAERLRYDPAIRWFVGGKALTVVQRAPSQMGRFETQWLAAPGNLRALVDLCGEWESMLKPVVVRCRGKGAPITFRADAAFATPCMYEFLEAEVIEYAIRLPANQILQNRIAHLLKRPVGRPPNEVRRSFPCFRYQAGSWRKPRRVMAKVEWHPGELFPRIGSIVTNTTRRTKDIAPFCNLRGTPEQWIKKGNGAIKWTRLSCHSFSANAVRLQLHALAYNLGNFLRTLATPEVIKDWSLTGLREKLIKIGAKVVRHGRYVAFQIAEVAIPRQVFGEILYLIAAPRSPPARVPT